MSVPAVNKEEPKELAERRAAWGGLGVTIYSTELQLQALAQQAILKVKVPKVAADLAPARELLKELKASQTDVQERRKKITGDLKPVIDRLMLPEKSFDSHIVAMEQAIIKVTNEVKEQERKNKLIDDEKKSVRQFATDQLVSRVERYNLKISNQVMFAFEYALTNGVKPEQIEEYVKKCSQKFKVVDFAEELPSYKPSLIPQADAQKIVEEVIVYDANSFVDKYITELKAKFVNYQIDYKNAEDALEKARTEQETKTATIRNEASQEKVASQLSFLSETLSVNSTIKDTKKLYKVSDVNSEEELIKALIKYAPYLLKHLKNKAFFDVIRKAIEAAKNKGEQKFDDVVFETVDKL